MGYVFRVRMASFFAGAATASFVGFYVLYKDYKVAHDSISQQMVNTICSSMKYCYPLMRVACCLLVVQGLHEGLDRRISALETLKQTEASQPASAAE